MFRSFLFTEFFFFIYYILVHFLVTDSVWTLLSILWMLRRLNVLKYNLQKAITFWGANCCRLYQKLGAHICSTPEVLLFFVENCPKTPLVHPQHDESHVVTVVIRTFLTWYPLVHPQHHESHVVTVVIRTFLTWYPLVPFLVKWFLR